MARRTGAGRRSARDRSRGLIKKAWNERPSAFPPLGRDGNLFRVDQTNNAYVYPGVGLGAIAELSPAKRDPKANLLAPLVELRDLSFHVALAVAKQAQAEGLAVAMSDEAMGAAVGAKMWEPLYAGYRRLRA